MGETVAILGAGNMGTALAQLIAANGHRVHLWSIEADVLAEIRDKRLNSKYLPEVRLHAGIEARWDLAEAVAEARLTIIAVPSQVVRTVAQKTAPFLKTEQCILNVAKGLEETSHLRMSQVLAQELPEHLHRGIATMGGPAIARDFARGVPTAVIVAAADTEAAACVHKTLENEFFKVETTADVAGVELAATLKNIYAIALGMCDGLGYGTNTKAFLASLALAEMASLAKAWGAQERTIYGLAGLGDLITTGFSPHSRNRTLGEQLAGEPGGPDYLRSQKAEGVTACKVVAELLSPGEAPLLTTVQRALFQGVEPRQALQSFLREFASGA